MELFTTLFIQDKQYPHLLTFSIEHNCVNISLSDGKDEMLKMVFVSCLNECIELDGDEYM